MTAEPVSDPVLDAALEGLGRGRVAESLDPLVATLARVRRTSSAEEWNRVVERVRAHPLREAIHRDPFAFRCYSKPRGYAGDGVALDYVLRARELTGKSRDPIGRLHDYATNGATGRALRFRRDAIAREIDATAARAERPARIFAAGAGHLREADRARALAGGRVARLVAFDADAENLEVVRRDYAALPVVTHHGTVRQLGEGHHLFGDMDLVYASGLFETLPQAASQGFARALFAMLAPRGVLFLTHFLASAEEAGFLEAFFDWRMAYRSQSELFDLVTELPADMVATWVYSENPDASLGVLTMQRR